MTGLDSKSLRLKVRGNGIPNIHRHMHRHNNASVATVVHTMSIGINNALINHSVVII